MEELQRRKKLRTLKRTISIVLLIAVTICSVLPAGLEAKAADVTESNPMYRLYNPNSGEHFYTANEGEKDYLSGIGWNYEGIGWNAPVSSNSPVYRLYNPYSSDHHYTMDEGERDYLSKTGWNYEGIGWYSDDAKSVPLYRQFNPNEVIGTHNYTTSLEENDWLCSTGWQAEGIGWYGVHSSSDDEHENEPLVESEKSVDAYSVTDIKLDKNSWTVSANVGAPGNCKLVVRFVEEDTYFADDYVAGQSYINNGNTLASCDIKAADEIKGVSAGVVNASALPAYYVIEAVLVDTNGKQLCSPYTSSDNTARHEEFESKDVDDFEGKNVLNFDDDTTTNFGVLNDEVKTVTATTVFEEIEEVGESHIMHYTIDSPSEDINVGDKVYLTDNQGEYLFKIASMNTLSDGKLYVTAARADDATMGFCIKDFYEYLDVEMESEEAESEDKYSDRKNDSTEGSETFPYNQSFEFDGMEITNSGDATIYIKIDIEYSGEILGDRYLKCDYVNTIESDFTLSAKVKVSGEKTSDKKKIDKKIPLVKDKMPLPVPVFNAFIDLELKIEFEASIGLTVTGNTYNKSGFNYNSIDGYQKIAENNTQWEPSSIEAEATIKAGINAGVGVEFLAGVVSVGLDAFLGVVINVKISATAGTPEHLCNLCLEGSVNAAVEVSINLKYSLDPFELGLWEFEGTIIGIDLYDGEYPLFDFYVSIVNPSGEVRCGKGKCPYDNSDPDTWKDAYIDRIKGNNEYYTYSYIYVDDDIPELIVWNESIPFTTGVLTYSGRGNTNWLASTDGFKYIPKSNLLYVWFNLSQMHYIYEIKDGKWVCIAQGKNIHDNVYEFNGERMSQSECAKNLAKAFGNGKYTINDNAIIISNPNERLSYDEKRYTQYDIIESF